MTYKPLRFVLPLGGALLTGAVGAAAYTARAVNSRGRPAGYSFSPWEVGVPAEEIEFRAEDGVTLRGWWFPSKGSDRVVVGLTGHRGLKEDLLGIGAGLWREGNNVLLFDFRGCGKSGGRRGSLAHREVLDARAAIEYVMDRVPPAHIGLIGYSMGGAVAIQAAAADERVRAVVADSSFSTMHDVIAHAFRRHRVPARALLRLTDTFNRALYGYRFAAVQPLAVVGKITPRPILIIHGGQDSIVPSSHGDALFRAAGEPKELWTLPDVEHCGGYFADRVRYVERVASFFKERLD